MRKFYILFIAIVLAANFEVIAQSNPNQDQDKIDRFILDVDKFITQSMAELKVIPGVSVAIVKGSKTIYSKGFGFADIESDLQATTNTPFYIASSTKSFVALAAVLLNEQEVIDLDAPITKYLPEGKFPKEVQAGQVKIVDLITHTSGLENRAIVFRTAYSGDHTQELLIELLSETTNNPEAPYGTFAYTNLGYNLLSLIMEKATGKPWQNIVKELIIDPLEMDRTTAYASIPLQQGWQEAVPYFAFGVDGPERISLQKKDNTMHAAGGMYATASDLAKWVAVNLSEGSLNGKQIFPANLIKGTHLEQANLKATFFQFQRYGYGLGWYLSKYGEETLIHHFGSFPGWRAHVSFMPDHDIGVVVLVNESTLGNTYADVVATYVYDWWLSGPESIAKYGGFVQRLVQQRNQSKEKLEADLAQRATRTFDFSAPVSAYSGTYFNKIIGTIHVLTINETIEIKLGNLHTIATPFTQTNTIRVELIPGQGEVIGFYVDDAGNVPFLQYNGMRFQKQ